MKDNFKTANDAFEYFYDIFNNYEDMCEEFGDTRALFNVGFYIHQPTNNHITASYRNGMKNMQKQNGNGIYQLILVQINQVNYTVEFHLYGKK